MFLKKISSQKTMKNLFIRRVFIALWFIATLLHIPTVDGQTCNSLCSFSHLRQADSGKCSCSVGWTGPNAVYTEIGGNRRVLADYCIQACFCNNDFKNSACGMTHHPQPQQQLQQHRPQQRLQQQLLQQQPRQLQHEVHLISWMNCVQSLEWHYHYLNS